MTYLTNSPHSYGISLEQFAYILLPKNNAFLKQKALFNRNLKTSYKFAREVQPLHHEVETLMENIWMMEFENWSEIEADFYNILVENQWKVKRFYEKIDVQDEGFIDYYKQYFQKLRYLLNILKKGLKPFSHNSLFHWICKNITFYA